MEKFAINGRSLASSNLVIEAINELEAIQRFGNTIGLMVNVIAEKQDSNDLRFVEFEIGTNREFVCYKL